MQFFPRPDDMIFTAPDGHWALVSGEEIERQLEDEDDGTIDERTTRNQTDWDWRV